MPIFDFRIRPPYKGFMDMVMYAQPDRRNGFTRNLGFTPSPAAEARSMEMTIEEMKKAGVEGALLVGRNSGMLGRVENDDVFELTESHAGLFYGAASIDASDRKSAMAEIKKAVERGFKAINIEPGAYATPMYTDDRRLYPVYALCEDLGIPLILMTGGNAGPDLSYTQPFLIDRVLADFPNLKIVASHGNWPWVTEILHVAFRRPNLYLSPDMYLPNMPGMDDYLKAANGFLADRFLYASSFPFCSIVEYAEWFEARGFSEENFKKVTWDNARKLLKID